MPVIISQSQLIVTGAPGTGSTSLLAAFADLPGAMTVPDEDVLDSAGRQILDAKHATVAQLISTDLLPSDHGLRILTSTRNPFDFWPAEWERTRTRWADELGDPTSWVHRQPGARRRIQSAVDNEFVTWLQSALEPELSLGGRRRLNRDHLDEADMIVRMEHLAGDLAELDLGVGLEIGHLNSSRTRRPFQSYFTDHLRASIEQMYAEDLAQFGYGFVTGERR